MRKIRKREFITQMALRNGITEEEATNAYHMILQEIQTEVEAGNSVSLTGFGTFYLGVHKGHPIQFDANEVYMPDYVMLKFRASQAFNKKLRDQVDPATVTVE